MIFATPVSRKREARRGEALGGAKEDIAIGTLTAFAAWKACTKVVGPELAMGCAAAAWLTSPMRGELKLTGVNLCQFPSALKPGEWLRDDGLCAKIGEQKTCKTFRLERLAFFAKERERFAKAGQVYPPDTVNINPIGVAACRDPKTLGFFNEIPVGAKLHVYGPTILQKQIAQALIIAQQTPAAAQFQPTPLTPELQALIIAQQAGRAAQFQPTPPPPPGSVAVFDDSIGQYRILAPT